ncbi:DedA family protein [Streptomyces asoensis]|uniref:DedA family protein n=1 Tax=Streptomyces asoensis TaxID=249586 RepID=UPI0034033AF4
MTTAVDLSSQLAVNVLDARSLLSAFGVLGVGVILFAETGLLIGFFLPGDSLLFTAGLLCTGTAGSGLKLSLGPLLAAAAVGALAGSQCGYLLGRRAGGTLLARSRSARLHEGAERAEELLERYGHAKAIVLARFVPVVRTVLNPMAGALRVPVRTFTVWQVASGLVWSLGLTLAGYALGSSVPNVDRYLLPIVAVIVALSLIPVASEVYRSRRAAKATAHEAREAQKAQEAQEAQKAREARG